MNKNLIEAKKRSLMGPDRLRELHGSILGSGKYQEIYIDAESIFEDINSKITMAMDEIDDEHELLKANNTDRKKLIEEILTAIHDQEIISGGMLETWGQTEYGIEHRTGPKG